MAKPPSDVAASELFLKLLERPAPSDVFAFPRTDESGEPVFDVRVFVLSESKIEMCRLRARKWLLEQARESAAATQLLDEHTIGDRLAKELLAEAVFENTAIYGSEEAQGKPVYRRLFRNAQDVGELTSDEVGALYGAYLLTQARFGPTDADWADERTINAWVQILAEGARPLRLSLLQSHQRDQLLCSLAARVSTVCKSLVSPPSNWEQFSESLRQSWQVGTGSSGEPAASSTPSRADPTIITREQAAEAAKALRRESQKA